jgi:hypothetical protein
MRQNTKETLFDGAINSMIIGPAPIILSIGIAIVACCCPFSPDSGA